MSRFCLPFFCNLVNSHAFCLAGSMKRSIPKVFWKGSDVLEGCSNEHLLATCSEMSDIYPSNHRMSSHWWFGDVKEASEKRSQPLFVGDLTLGMVIPPLMMGILNPLNRYSSTLTKLGGWVYLSPNTGNNWEFLYSIFNSIYIIPSWKSWVDFGGPLLKRLFRHHGSASANYSSPKPPVRLDIFSNGGVGSGECLPPNLPKQEVYRNHSP